MAHAPARPRSPRTVSHLGCGALAIAAALLAAGCGGPERPKSGSDELAFADYHVAEYQNQNWYTKRAEIRLRRGMLDGALADCDAALACRGKKAMPPDTLPELYELRANVHEQRKDHAAALADIEKAFAMAVEQRGPTDPMWHLNTKRQTRGRLLCRLGRLAEAEAVAVEMLATGSTSLEFHPGLELITMVYQAR